MKRDYSNQDHNDETTFFLGTEVEDTPTKGMKTLFVVGVQDPLVIMHRANNLNCNAIYFGANHSFELDHNPERIFAEWQKWEDMIIPILNHPDKFWCTLDFDVKYAEDFLECSFTEFTRFIPMISVKLPYISQFNYNTTLKIDDRDFEATNHGVWCHSLHELQDKQHFTSWKEYNDDTTI